MIRIQINKRAVTLLILLFIITGGAALRLYKLDYQSLWNDELTTIRRTGYDYLPDVITKGLNIHPPGLNVFYYFVTHIFGDSPVIVRMPAVLAGIASVYLIFLLACRLYSRKEGLISAALTAFLWCPVYYSQEARPYSLLIFLTLLVVWLLIRFIDRFGKGNKYSIYLLMLYGFTAIICSYIHYFGTLFIFLLGVTALVYSFRRKQMFLRLLTVHLAVLAAFSFWIPGMFRQFTGEPSYILDVHFIDFIYYFEFLFNWSEPLTKLVFFSYCFLFVYTIYRFTRRKKYKTPAKVFFSPEIMLGLWMIAPFWITYLISDIFVNVLTLKNLIISLPPAYILFSRAITAAAVKPVFQFALSAVILFLFLWNLLFTQDYYNTITKEQFREGIACIAEQDSRLDNSVVIGFAWHEDFFNYYFKRFDCQKRIELIAGEPADTIITGKYLAENNPHYVWYIRGHRPTAPEFTGFLERQLTLLDHKPFRGVDVWLFERKHKALR
ncbi:MAG: glycosyltransferase family 39 protein [Bacteroidetes bacterium]|nr:glycosyltransferase family 39 protein [Bacteroidota bacterium]